MQYRNSKLNQPNPNNERSADCLFLFIHEDRRCPRPEGIPQQALAEHQECCHQGRQARHQHRRRRVPCARPRRCRLAVHQVMREYTVHKRTGCNQPLHVFVCASAVLAAARARACAPGPEDTASAAASGSAQFYLQELHPMRTRCRIIVRRNTSGDNHQIQTTYYPSKPPSLCLHMCPATCSPSILSSELLARPKPLSAEYRHHLTAASTSTDTPSPCLYLTQIVTIFTAGSGSRTYIKPRQYCPRGLPPAALF